MENFIFNRATVNDVKLLVELRTTFALELSGLQEAQDVKDLEKQLTEYFTKATTENTCISYIAYRDNRVAGIGSVMLRQQPGNFKNPSGKWGYIMNMYTVPEFRRQGVCKGILEALANDCWESGITALELHATPAGAVVYEKSGFTIHTEPTYRKYKTGM